MPDVVEDADTLEGNARLKAAAIAAATGEPAVADDTGLEVAALDGAPGVRTGPLRRRGRHLRRQPGASCCRRSPASPTARARFRTVAMVVWPDGRELAVEGVCDGTIATAERGARGFGYDAVFVPDDGDGRTFAEMTEDEKHAISHRGRAFRALLARLAAR